MNFQKRAQAQAIMKELGIQCWVLFVADNQAEAAHLPLIDAPVGASYRAYVLTPDKAIAVVYEIEAAIQKQSGFGVNIITDRNLVKEVARTIDGLVPKNTPIALNYSITYSSVDTVGYGRLQLLEKELRNIKYEPNFISADELIFTLASTKLPYEIEKLREAAQLTDAVLREGFAQIKPGMTEQEVAHVFHELVAKRMENDKRIGYSWEKAGNPIVLAGDGIAGSPHIHPSGRVIERGNTVYVDFGLSVDGLHGDLQHVGYVLKEGEREPPREVRQKFELVVHSIEAGMKKAKPGVYGWEVDKVCRDIIVTAGWPTYKHGTGHQLGHGATHAPGVAFGPRYADYTNDEKPGVAPNPVSALPLREGYVMTIEPRIQVANGVSIEIDGVITKNGYGPFVPIQEAIHLIG